MMASNQADDRTSDHTTLCRSVIQEMCHSQDDQVDNVRVTHHLSRHLTFLTEIGLSEGNARVINSAPFFFLRSVTNAVQLERMHEVYAHA